MRLKFQKQRHHYLPAVLLCLLVTTPVFAGLQWQVEAEQIEAAGIRIEKLQLISGSEPSAITELRLEQLSHAVIGPLGNVYMQCPANEHWTQCRAAQLQWLRPGGESQDGQLELHEQTLVLNLAPMSASFVIWPELSSLEFERLPIAWLPDQWTSEASLIGLTGHASLRLDVGDPVWQFVGGLEGLSFDTEDGLLAAAELGFSVEGAWDRASDRLQADLRWSDGEALLGALYLPPPEQPFEFAFELLVPDRVEALAPEFGLRYGEDLRLSGALNITPAGLDQAIELSRLNADIEIEQMQLAPLWLQGLESLAEAYGLAGVQPSGTVKGQLRIRNGRLDDAWLQLNALHVDDQRERFSLVDLGGQLRFQADTQALDLDLNWQDATLLGLQLGGSALRLESSQPGTIQLAAPPFRLPVLDGHLVVNELRWSDWLGEQPQFALDAELEPIELASLSRAFGWPALGGELSGRLPGMRFDQGVLRFDGGINVSIFSGAVQISDLSVERPLGPLPALTADIELNQLDLFELTGAFDFGSMQGRMSGYMRDLRLLNWQPVAFDAWFATDPRTSDKRRISQQAVDSISSLSGAGGAVLSNTVLQIFDDFPYANVGLGCRLSESVCHMRGLQDLENGGYMIVEGRGLPHLNIIGYQRRVNWNQLLEQIRSAAEGGVSVGSRPEN